MIAGPAIPLANAGLFTLTDGNSTASFDTASQSGASSWTVGGVSQLYQQWFWYRVGNTAESSIDTLPINVEGTTDTDFDGNQDTLFVRYQTANFQIEVRFGLQGGLPASGASDMSEQIAISNLSNSPMSFSFFQYTDFDLEGFPSGDTAVFVNPNAVQQSRGSARMTETVISPAASHREIGFFPNTLNSLNDGLPTTLSDTPIGLVVGPGDVTWAFQWDFVIAPNSTVQISKDKNLNIPEPGTWALMVLGIVGLLAHRLRKSRR